ncbi:protein SPMIP1-like [Lineus longissimus]|uniref:protein SPMIP1-like n=1 Tax=Lineus longissimus TaxID=88925 RepID=UPI00315CAB30
MSGRNYPADTQKQKFLEESYNKERDTRLQWFYKRQDGSDKAQTGGSKQYQVFRKKIEGQHSKPAEELAAKLPKIPQAKQHHRTIKDFSDNLAEQANALGDPDNLLTEMRPVTPKVRKSLYEGFSKDGTGRYQYLHHRYGYNPENKYEFPILSSWEYGWRLSDVIRKEEIKKPTHGRTRIVADTFYTRTGIPDLHVNQSY